MQTIEYRSNNSGGDWWLTLKDWQALEAAGWRVEWEQLLGSPARYASKEFNAIEDAMGEFERLTGQRASERGCECCGRPHYFRVVSESELASRQ